ncbi:MAG: hypothetical protein ACLRK6_06760 [Anaerostipes hadrus]
MEENKTGVWIRCMNGKEVKYNHNQISSFNVGEIVEVDNDDVYVKFKIETVELKFGSAIIATYTIKPQGIITKTLHPYQYKVFDDAESIVMDVYKNDVVNIIVPYWHEKLRYRLQSINSTEAAIRITRQETMNEDLEIHTGTILADEIKIGTLAPPPLSERRVSALPHYQQQPITATSEAEKNWWKECYGVSETERGLRAEIPTLDVWNGETSATLTFSSEKLDEIMSELTENEEEKEMYTKNLKEMIKKPIYVDKEITVKEPMLDNNGKQIEKDGKPVFKVKHYHGMVKILWVSGAETVAYVEGNDVYDRENGFKTCVLKYLCGNAGAHDAVDFWTNKYVKYPSGCIEVTENLCKLEEIIENDKQREEERKGLPHAKFLRRTVDRLMHSFSDDKLHYAPEDEKLANEFKKLAKKYFPELKCREIYINDRKQDEVFVAIK